MIVEKDYFNVRVRDPNVAQVLDGKYPTSHIILIPNLFHFYNLHPMGGKNCCPEEGGGGIVGLVVQGGVL